MKHFLAALGGVCLFAPLLLASSDPPQAPRVGDINFYGLHKLTPERLMNATGLNPGGALPASKGDLEEKIEDISGVVLANVQAVCCDGANASLFIGVEERGAPHAAFRSPPAGDVALPQEIAGTYARFLAAVQRAAARGHTTDDLTAGHSLMDDPEPRAIQLRFIELASAHLDVLRDVLRNSSDPDQRAAAAAVIGYAPKKQDALNDLQFALDDPDEAVRANAIRSLKAIGVLASKQPQLGLKIAPVWFIELLHSVVLSDRVEATAALVVLTDHHEQAAILQLKERALPDLAEMARWPSLRYALPPFLLLGRAAGLTDEQIQQRWLKGEREPVIRRAMVETPMVKSAKPGRK